MTSNMLLISATSELFDTETKLPILSFFKQTGQMTRYMLVIITIDHPLESEENCASSNPKLNRNCRTLHFPRLYSDNVKETWSAAGCFGPDF